MFQYLRGITSEVNTTLVCIKDYELTQLEWREDIIISKLFIYAACDLMQLMIGVSWKDYCWFLLNKYTKNIHISLQQSIHNTYNNNLIKSNRNKHIYCKDEILEIVEGILYFQVIHEKIK